MDISPYKAQMQKAVDYLENEFQSLQIGRASTSLVENISVEASYGSMKIPQIAHITILDPQTLKIEPWDKKETKNIEKAIYDAELWLAPQNEWEYVMIKIPALTQDRRTDITKKIKITWEDTKAQLRQTRQDGMKTTKKLLDDKEISQDQHKNNEANIDWLVKDYNTQIDNLVKLKSDEIMTV